MENMKTRAKHSKTDLGVTATRCHQVTQTFQRHSCSNMRTSPEIDTDAQADSSELWMAPHYLQDFRGASGLRRNKKL